MSQVLCGVVKWCWSRLVGGVVGWEAYELFRIGEQGTHTHNPYARAWARAEQAVDSDMARDAFATFIPISVDSDARTKIVFDFFDLLAAIAAHGKSNGLGGRKLSRLAGWWAFEQTDTGSGFDGGYRSWARYVGSHMVSSNQTYRSSAADATSHLFFAYLRSLTPESINGVSGVSTLPISLQNLVKATEYPPPQPPRTLTSKVVMIVDSVSPTPFALLRRAKHFEYRDDDEILQRFSNYDDPVKALTDECRRVLKSISSVNQSAVSTSKDSTSLPDASWSRFEDIGFGGFGDYSDHEDEANGGLTSRRRNGPQGLRSAPQSKNDLGRPTTPSWADFLSSGFVDDASTHSPAPLALPSDKVLPPIETIRGTQSSQSHRRGPQTDSDLEPGELASINVIDLEDAFWWVWITSLSSEEPVERKAVFGRCALIETRIGDGTWLIIEEMVKGAAPEPEEGAYIVEKKSRFAFTKKGRLGRNKQTTRKPLPVPKPEPYHRSTQVSPLSKTSIGPDQHARIQAAAAVLQQKQKQSEDQFSPSRARNRDAMSTKTNSVFTLQPVIMSEAAPAMQWASKYDKNAIRTAYLGNNLAGKGSATNLDPNGPQQSTATNGSVTPVAANKELPRNASYGFSAQNGGLPEATPFRGAQNGALPALPAETPKEQAHLAPTAQQASAPLPPLPGQQAPPLPATPLVHPSNQAVTEAAGVALPVETPLEQTPRQDYTQFPTTNGTISPPLPESKKGNKLKKEKKEGGFMSRFGKKKVPPFDPRPADGTAVAAARAALSGPETRPNNNARPNNLGRRISTIGRKRAPRPGPTDPGPGPAPAPPLPENREEPATVHPDDLQFDPPQDDLDETPTEESLSQQPNQQPPQPAYQAPSPPQDEHSTPAKFREGPMIDEPAFVPEDSPEQSHRTIPQATTTMHQAPPSVSSVSADEDSPPPSPAKDRWAQIRKNAAERAARQSEEQYAREHGYAARGPDAVREDKDDEGDSSGEESKLLRCPIVLDYLGDRKLMSGAS